MAERFPAWFADRNDSGFRVERREITLDDLMPGDVTVRVQYSSVNYKDGLASTPDGKIVRTYPMVLGIELAGEVVASQDDRFYPGDAVVVAGFGLSQTHYGGYSRYARVPADWVVPLPDGLSPREAMAIGVAGFTAGMAVEALRRHGTGPEDGPVLVTGASGGVGSVAVALLARLGYQVIASSGKPEAADMLRRLGAHEVMDRALLMGDSGKSLERERWAAAIDQVGGRTLANVLKSIRHGGAVALTGLVGGSRLETTVFPFILRGVSLIGIDSAYCPMPLRRELWRRFANEWKLASEQWSAIAREISFDDLPDALQAILQGRVTGRIVVRV